MKKHLIAAAVAAAVAVPAAAQVTIGGNIDTSVIQTSENSNRSSQTLVSSGTLSTPTLSVRGTEDLGGGLKAFFTIISRLGTDEPITTSTTTSAANTSANSNAGAAVSASSAFTMGDRGSLVGVSGGFGEIAIGRSDGSMMNTIQGGFLGNRTLIGAFNTRPDNSISYRTPTMNGIQARVLHSVGNETATSTNDGRFTELSLQYVAGPLAVRVATTSLGGAAARNDVGGGSSSNVSNGDVEQAGFSVNYNAGFANLNLRYIDNKQGVAAITAANKGSNTGVGALIPVGNGLSLALDYYKQDRDDATYDIDSTSVGLIKDLSKRTNVYAVYQTVDFGSAATATGGALGVAGIAGESNSAFGFGIRHSF